MPSPVDMVHALLALVWSTGAVVSDRPALAVVVLMVALIVVAVASALAGTDSLPGASVHPRRGIEVSSPLAQSDPDAPGHAHPRAPGCTAVAV